MGQNEPCAKAQRGNGRQDARKRREERFRIWHIGTIWQSFSLWLCTNFLQVHIFWTGSLRDVPCAVLKPCTLPEEAGQKGCRRGWVTVLQGTPGPKKFAHGKDFFGPWKAFCFQRAASVKTLGKGFSKFVRGARTMRESRHFFLFVNLRARLFGQVDRPELYGNIGSREVGKCLAGPNGTR